MFKEYFEKQDYKNNMFWNLILLSVLLPIVIVVEFLFNRNPALYLPLSGVLAMVLLFAWWEYFHQARVNSGKVKENPLIKTNLQISAGKTMLDGYVYAASSVFCFILGIVLLLEGIIKFQGWFILGGFLAILIGIATTYLAKYNFWQAKILTVGRVY